MTTETAATSGILVVVLVTVLTPAYNRASYLARLYASLEAQQYRDFEWLVIDDGSTDETRSVMEGFARDASFEVRYMWQPNGGKHIALNTGVRNAVGRFTAVIDSDDWYEPQALDRLVAEWGSIDMSTFAEVQALCADENGNVIGDRFPCHSAFDSDAFELVYRYKLNGDRVGMHRTAVLREFPFPDAYHGTYVTEALVWLRIAERYRTRCLNEVLGRKEYLPGGITIHDVRQEVARAGPRREFFRQVAQTPRQLPVRERLRAYANWTRNAHLAGVPLRSELARARRPVTFAALAPVGLGLAVRDRARLRAQQRYDQR